MKTIKMRSCSRIVALALLLACVARPASAGAGPHRVADALMRRAEAADVVRVIVGLDVASRLEAELRDATEVGRQRAGIARARGDLLAALPAGSFSTQREFETIPFVAIEADADALRVLDSMPGVLSVEEDRVLAPLLAQSTVIVGADKAWDAGFTGAGWTVAILDTGVDRSHSLLTGKVISEACYSSASSCPNGRRTQIGSGAGVPCRYAPSGCQHGTHVAGIAAGTGPSFSGVAKGASIIAIQVFSKLTGSFCIDQGEDPCALTSSSDVIAGLERVLALKDAFSIAAVNLSVGASGYSTQTACDAGNPAMKAAIDNLRSVGIATVVAAGNDGFTNKIGMPACLSPAISVGATTKADNVPTFSNSAWFLSLLAPGQSITSSIPGGAFDSFTGTSMAAPHVTGAWAIRRQSHPASSVADVLSDLRLTGMPITDGRNSVTTPRLDIGEALITCGASLSVGAGDPPLAVDFTATDGAGTPPFSYTWDFDDGSAPAGGELVSHTFESPGGYQVVLRGQDDNGITCSDVVAVDVNGPRISGVRAAGSPFRLIITGSSFQSGATVEINGLPAPSTIFKSATRLAVMKGAALKVLVPEGVAVDITVTNPYGIVSMPFSFTR